MAKLFEIPLTGGSSLDVTPFIVLNTYNVSTQSVYEGWTDGKGQERRSVKRRKLQGSFSLRFFKAADYQSFLSAVESERATGFDYIAVNAYDNKLRAARAANVYLDFEVPDLEPSLGYSFNEDIEVTVTER